MQHTLIAVFDNRNDAQAAKDELYAAGFAGAEIRQNDGSGAGMGAASTTGATSTTSNSSTSGTSGTSGTDEGIGASIRNFFSDLFGGDDQDQSGRYAEAVARGQHVLTLVTDSEQEVERAADIVERHGPVDIDEEAGGRYVSGGQSLSGGETVSSGVIAAGQAGGTPQGASLQQGGASLQGGSATGSQQRGAEGAVLPVVEEELKVGKREVQRGGVRVFQRVVETPVNETVSLREEHVSVERRPVDQPLGSAAMGSLQEPFQEKSIELRETAEEAVVEKTARVVEEVVVGKQVTQTEQQISDTVRHTEVEVEQLGATGTSTGATTGMTGGSSATTGMAGGSTMMGADDNDYFRKHYDATYGTSGRSYQDYMPAYSYGSTMAANEQYRGRAWNDVEPNLRQDWESRNPGSAWDNFKAAVQHGWQKITG